MGDEWVVNYAGCDGERRSVCAVVGGLLGLFSPLLSIAVGLALLEPFSMRSPNIWMAIGYYAAMGLPEAATIVLSLAALAPRQKLWASHSELAWVGLIVASVWLGVGAFFGGVIFIALIGPWPSDP